MKQWEFRDYWKLLKANIRFSANSSFAYYMNNFGSLASTMFYMLSYVIFLTAVFSKFKLVAGYNYSEILLLSLVGQMNFYLMWSFSLNNIIGLGESVKTGELDLILTKPLPHLFFLTFRKIDLNLLVFGVLPSISPVLFMLSRSHDFKITLVGFALAMINYFFGQIASHCFTFICNLPSFWTGEYRGFKNLSHELIWFSESLPFEGYPKSVQFLGVFIIPNLIHSAVTTSLLLGRMDGRVVLVTGMVAGLFLLLKQRCWDIALRHYSSASS